VVGVCPQWEVDGPVGGARRQQEQGTNLDGKSRWDAYAPTAISLYRSWGAACVYEAEFIASKARGYTAPVARVAAHPIVQDMVKLNCHGRR